jgi:intergrase/recombinase
MSIVDRDVSGPPGDELEARCATLSERLAASWASIRRLYDHERLDTAIESAVRDFARTARDEELTPEQLVIELKRCLAESRAASLDPMASRALHRSAVQWALDEFFRE